jgi:hypothetical protein
MAKHPIPYSSLHRAIVIGLGNKFIDLLELLAFFLMIRGALSSGNHPLFICVSSVFDPYPISTIPILYLFMEFLYLFSLPQKLKQMWHQPVLSVSTLFFIPRGRC